MTHGRGGILVASYGDACFAAEVVYEAPLPSPSTVGSQVDIEASASSSSYTRIDENVVPTLLRRGPSFPMLRRELLVVVGGLHTRASTAVSVAITVHKRRYPLLTISRCSGWAKRSPVTKLSVVGLVVRATRAWGTTCPVPTAGAGCTSRWSSIQR